MREEIPGDDSSTSLKDTIWDQLLEPLSLLVASISFPSQKSTANHSFPLSSLALILRS